VGFGVLWWTRPNPHVTVKNFERLDAGQTEAEVEAIFGTPGIPYPGTIVIGNKKVQMIDGFGLVVSPTDRVMAWQGTEISVAVVFDTESRVTWATKAPVVPSGPLARLRRLLGL
jgi:hypothetical protein